MSGASTESLAYSRVTRAAKGVAKCLSAAALPVLRTGAAGFVVLHYRLQLGSAADLPALLAVGLAALTTGRLLAGSRLRAWVAVAAVAALPWVLRGVLSTAFGAWLSWLSAGAFDPVVLQGQGAVGAALRTLPLQVDLVFYPGLPLFYLLAGMSLLVYRRPSAVTGEVGVYAALLALLFWNQAGDEFSLYEHPGMLAVAVAVFVLLELGLLFLTQRAEPARPARVPKRTRGAPPAADRFALHDTNALLWGVLPVVFIALFAVLGQYRDQALARRGGLLQPTLLSFELSDYLALESEISISAELLALYRAENAELSSAGQHKLLRRFVLSGYSPRRGFYREHEREPDPVPERVQRDAVAYPQPPAEYSRGATVRQDIYLINLDPRALIGLNQPVQSQPLPLRQGGSFAAAYRLASIAPVSAERVPAQTPDASAETVGPERHSYYTEYGDDSRVRRLAEEVTCGAASSAEQLRRIEAHLQNEFYYSRRPGIAADGNQLHHFLFESKRGYCSYFAHAMALMARSLGVPARVVVGFSVVPELELMGFHPVRADMAHAWVEAYLPGLGWMQYDPTSGEVVPGEELDDPAPPERVHLAALVEEIFANESENGLPVTPGAVRELDPVSGLRRLDWMVVLVTALLGIYLVALAVPRGALAVAVRRAGDPRREARLRFRRARSRLQRAGLGWSTGESVREYAERVDKYGHALGPLAEQYLAACFAPRFGGADRQTVRAAEGSFNSAFRSAVGPARRVCALLRPDSVSPARRDSRRGGRERGLDRNGTRGRRSPRGLIVIGVLVALIMLAALVARRIAAEEDAGGRGAAELEMSEYAVDAEQAIRQQHYRHARELLLEGIQHYPNAVRLRLVLGDLYFGRGLYRRALESYREAERINPNSYAALESLAATLGRLNRENEAAGYLERFLKLYPGRPGAISDLGWLYYKTRRTDEGIALLTGALNEHPENRSLHMTLGTLYAGQYEHGAAAESYREAITIAERDGDRLFAAVAYYNLAILERRFDRYEQAYAAANDSVTAMKRPTGYMALGGLYERRLDREKAESAYRRAYQLERDAPLSRMNLAGLFSRFGEPERAAAYARSVYQEEKRSWMFQYGIDLQRHRMGVDRQLSEIYAAIVEHRLLTPAESLAGLLRLRGEALAYRTLALYHDLSHRRRAHAIGFSLLRSGNVIDGGLMLRQATDRHAELAARYLDVAARRELEVNPGSEAAYRAQRAALLADSEQLRAAVDELGSKWERRRRADALQTLVRLYRRSGDQREAARAAGELYRLNPAALRNAGLRLPVVFDLDPELSSQEQARVRRAMHAAGFQPMAAVTAEALHLRLHRYGDDRLVYVLELMRAQEHPNDRGHDPERGREVLRRGVVDYESNRAGAARSARALAQQVFSTR